MKLDYIITGTPRSASRYMAELFTSVGIHISHELIFGMPGLFHIPTPGEDIEGDSSWLAVPLLNAYENVNKIHVVRNPIKVISSMKSKNFLEVGDSNLYTNYVFHCMPNIDQYEGLDRYLYFWIHWNESAEYFIDKFYRIEDITKSPKKFFDSIGVSVPKGTEFFKGKSNIYDRGKDISMSSFKSCELYGQLVDRAAHYGYKLST